MKLFALRDKSPSVLVVAWRVAPTNGSDTGAPLVLFRAKDSSGISWPFGGFHSPLGWVVCC